MLEHQLAEARGKRRSEDLAGDDLFPERLPDLLFGRHGGYTPSGRSFGSNWMMVIQMAVSAGFLSFSISIEMS